MLDFIPSDASLSWFLGQGFALLALVLCIIGFSQKQDHRLRIVLIAGNTAFAIQFALLGSWAGAFMTGIVIARIFLARVYHRNLYVMGGLLALSALTATFDWHGWADWAALVAGTIGTIGMFAFHGSVMRWWLLIAAFFWALSNIAIGSFGGAAAEFMVMATSATTIWRLEMDKRRLAV
ncbi:YgjV family protein [Thalassospira sp. MA62]|nr:YgjV family protein [Thalassospira sp. MA62]